jgi:hypothetical protein
MLVVSLIDYQAGHAASTGAQRCVQPTRGVVVFACGCAQRGMCVYFDSAEIDFAPR